MVELGEASTMDVCGNIVFQFIWEGGFNVFAS